MPTFDVIVGADGLAVDHPIWRREHSLGDPRVPHVLAEGQQQRAVMLGPVLTEGHNVRAGPCRGP